MGFKPALHLLYQDAKFIYVLFLFFVAGPKYMLKLQQEITAMRVVISMENNIDFDTSKMHTIKRYMSELKDEDSVSNGGLRCRELDCLRAYYFVAILSFLRKNLEKKEDIHIEKVESESTNIEIESESKNTTNIQDEKSESVAQSETDISVEKQCTEDTENSENATNTQTKSAEAEDKKCETDANIDVKDVNLDFSKPDSTSNQKEDNIENLSEAIQFCVKVSEDKDSKTVETTDQNLLGKASPEKGAKPKPFKFMTFENQDYRLSVSKLSFAARGLLWDIQGKRYALTETLGYIYKGISQLLLDLKPSSISPSPSQSEVNLQTSGENMSSDLHAIPSHETAVGGESGTTSVASLISVEGSGMGKKCHSSEPVIAKPLASENPTEHYHRSLSTGSRTSLQTGSSQHGSIDKDLVEDTELYMSSEWLIKSRKVLWEDEPHHPFATFHSGKENLTSIINPNKYINVPDEWYNMPADQKYTMKYVTMAILKEEQEYMMQELKNGPDAIQV